MKWKNCHRDHPPADQQTVLLSVGGIYYLTTYDVTTTSYRLLESPEQFFHPQQNASMYWIEIGEPPKLSEVTKN